MSCQITILGSGGWIPTESRQTCSALLRCQNRAILIDAGTGVSRLRQSSLLDGVEELALVLTHFHLDHVVGLGYLAGVLPFPPAIYAPGKMLLGESSSSIIKRIVSPPYYPVPIDKTFSRVFELGDDNDVLGWRIFTRRQERHSTPTAALRFEDRFAYITDTAFDEGNIDFAYRVPLLFHEAWQVGSDGDETHTPASEAGRLASEAEVGDLRLIHLSPFLPPEEILLDARQEFPEARLARDGETIQVS